MTLLVSGAISLGDVNTELGLSATAQIGMNDAAVRELFGVAAGAISLSNGYGRTRQVMVAGTHTNLGIIFVGYDAVTPFGSLTPAAISGYTVDAAYRESNGGGFVSFNLWMLGVNVPQNIFSSLKINGQTYSSASATYSGNTGGRTWWFWTTPDPSLANGNTYNAIFAP